LTTTKKKLIIQEKDNSDGNNQKHLAALHMNGNCSIESMAEKGEMPFLTNDTISNAESQMENENGYHTEH